MRIVERLGAIGIMAGLVAALGACDDNLGLAAFAVRDPVNLTVYAMNGTAQRLPSGLSIRSLTVAEISPAWETFDLVFDLNSTNDIVVHTVRNISTELVAVPRVGLQKSTLTFDQLIDAPTSGYVYDSLLTVSPGQLVVVDKVDPSCSRYAGAFLGYNIRAKFIVDSVNTSRRAIYLKVLSNPNCGFKSLEPGEPKD